MSSKKSVSPAEQNNTVAKIDWAALLSKEDFQNLAGYFDVLIEMDFEAKQRNEERSKYETNIKNDSSNKPNTN